MRAITVFTGMLFIIPMLIENRALGQESSVALDVRSLKGIDSVQVVIDLTDTGKVSELDKYIIRTDVELKLRGAGMRVLSEEEESKAPGSPYLYLNVNLVGTAAAVEIQLMQTARLVRNDEIAVGATWSQRSLSTNSTAPIVRGLIKDQVDTFLNAWLSVNPK